MFELLLCFLVSGWYSILWYMLFVFLLVLFFDGNYWLGLLVDDLSFSMMMLSSLLILFTFISFKTNFLKLDTLYVVLLVLLLLVLLLFFCCSMGLLFFVSFELSLIPILVLILGWGYQVERIQASFYLLMYMVLFSMPFFMGLLYVSWLMKSVWFSVYTFFVPSTLLELSFVMVFLAKTPVYLLHMWLPKAHVEAPVSGSVLLAGIMLKLGGYGFFRVVGFLMLELEGFFSLIFLFGSFFSTIITFFQSDMKALVAYSSIAHMTFMFVMVMNSCYSLLAVLISIMLSHGFISSSMFMNMNVFSYYTTSRYFYFINGFGLTIFGSFLILFSMMMFNFSVPPSLSFFGEFFSVVSIFTLNHVSFFILALYVLLVCYYCLFLFYALVHGKSNVFMFVMQEYQVDYVLFFAYLLFSVMLLFVLDLFF